MNTYLYMYIIQRSAFLHVMFIPLAPPPRRPGMSHVSPLSGISGLSFDSTLVSLLLFFCQIPLLCLCYLFAACWPIFLIFFFFTKKFLSVFCLEIGFFWMAPIYQLGEVSWSVVCAACCLKALGFAVMQIF